MQSHKWRQVGTNKRGIASLKESKRSRHGVQAPHLLNEYHYANEAALGSNAAPLQDVALRDWTIVNVPWLFFCFGGEERGNSCSGPECCCRRWNDSSSFSSAATGTHASSFVKLRPWTTLTDLVPVAVIEDLEQQPNGFIRWMREINGVGHWRPMVASWVVSEVGRKRIVAESFDLVNRISAISPSGRLKCQAKEEGHCVSHGSPHELI